MALALTPKTRLEENIGRITRRLLIDAATYANRAQLMQNGNGDKSRKVVVALLYMQAAQAIESVININSALDQKRGASCPRASYRIIAKLGYCWR